MNNTQRRTAFTTGLMLLGLLVVGVLPAAAQSFFIDEARGSGLAQAGDENLEFTGEEGRFSFRTSAPGASGEVTIDLRATNRATGDKIIWKDGVVLASPNATIEFFGGSCEVDGLLGDCFGFARDHGEPGENDEFQLVYHSPGGNGLLSGFPGILSGNIEIEVVTISP